MGASLEEQQHMQCGGSSCHGNTLLPCWIICSFQQEQRGWLPHPTESHCKVLTLWNTKTQQYLQPVEQGFHSLEIFCEIWQQHFPSDSNHEIFDTLYNCYP